MKRKITIFWFIFLFVVLIPFTGISQVTTFPWDENFEGTFLPTGWVKELGDPANDITQSSAQNHTTGGTYSARFSSYSYASDYNQYLFSEQISVTAGYTQLTFWHRKYNTSSETLEWGISTTTQSSSAVSTWTSVSLSSTDWQMTTVDLSSYVGQDIYIGWHYYGDYLYYVYLDDVNIDAPPACPAPSAQTETSITTSGADLGWTDASGSHWDIYVVPTGDPAPDQATTPTANDVTASPYTWSSGSAGTTYDWYVRSDCGQDNSNTSTWIGPSTFTTNCNAFTASFSENFDGVTAPAIPNCWSSIVNSTSTYAAIETSTSGTPHSSANHVRLYNSSDTSATLLLISPQLSDLTNQSNQIRFWAKGSSGYELIVGTMTDPTNEATFTSFSTINLTSTYTEYTVLFDDSYTGSDEYIAFKHGLGGTYRTLYIDDFTYEPIPACPPPSAQTETNITTSGADLGWTDASGSHWDIYVVPTGDPAPDQATTPTANDVTANPYTWSGGSAGTTYDWYVQADCGGGSTSTWTGPSTFTTLCVTVTSFPFTEDFENGGLIPNCWTNDPDDAGGEWEFVTTNTHGATADHTTGTGYYSLLNDYSVQAANSPFNLLTPPFDLSSGGPYQMTYWAWIGPDGDANPIHVDVSDDGGTTWTTDVYVNDQTTTSSWFENTVPLSSFTTNNVIIRFRGVSIYGYNTDNSGIDDVTVEEMPACPAPSAQTTDSLKLNSAQLSWTEIGSATEWNIRIGTTGYDTTGTSYAVVTNDTITVDTLLASTTYDWYVRASCGGGDYSTWIGPQSFTTSSGLASDPYPADGASDVLVTSDTLEWSPVDNATKYVLNIGTTSGGDDVLSGYGTTDTAYITGSSWDYSTQYYWSVNTIYNGTNDTVTGTEWNFTTECGVYTPTYSQNFASYLPFCWSEAEGFLTANSTLTGTSSSWAQDDFANVAINGPSAKINIWGTSKKEWLISPTIDLGGGGYQLEFDLALTHYATTNADTLGADDTLAVIISTDNGATWSTSNILQVWTASTLISNTGEHVVIDLSSYSSSTTKFAFYGASTVSNKDNDVFIDNFTVQIPPSCPAPSAQSTDNIKLNAAQLSWSENGSATEWNIRIGTTGYDTTGTSFSVVTNDTITVDTLLASTRYDWYVRASCGGGDYSSWIGPQSFTTSSGLASGSYPADGASGVLVTSDTLEWSPVDNATKYVLNIGTTSGGDDVLSGYGTTDTAYITGSSWDYSTQYFWSVNTVYNGTNDTVNGTEWDFATECDAAAVPYFEDFDEVTAPDFPGCMTVENTNGDSQYWQTTASGLSAPNSAIIAWNPDGTTAMDDWFFTQELSLLGGHTYEVSFTFASDPDYPEKLAVDWGTVASSTAMSGTPIFDDNNILGGWYAGTGTFTPTTDGSYYVGFHGYSDANEYYLLVDDIQVAEQQTSTTWNGSASNDWDDPSNWSSGVPSSNTDITIPTTATNFPTLTHARHCNTITIESDATGDASILNDSLLIISGGNATIQRYLPAGVWHDFSPSAEDQTLNAMYFNGSPDVWLTQYNEPDNTRTYLTTLTDIMLVGSGYEIWVGGSSAVTVNFTGEMNISDLALTSASIPPLSYSGADPLGYNLIGNPFASPLALDSGSWNMANVDSTFWIWDNSTYKDYNTTTKAGSITGGIIPMGQGFFIHANAASPTITIPVAARVHSGQAYYKNSNATGSSLEVMSLRATYNTDKYDELNIAFLNGAKDEFENHDTRKMFAFNGEAPQVYAIIPDEEVSLNSLPVLAPGEEKTVEVGYKAGTNGEQTLVADVSKLEDIDVVLEDLKLNKIQNLNDNPVYKFDATTYQNPDRFRIHFNRSVTGIDNNEASTAVRAYSYNKTLYIVSKGDMVTQTKHLDVYDIMGRKVLSKQIPGGEVISVPLTISDAYVVVRIISAGEVYTTKVFIK